MPTSPPASSLQPPASEPSSLASGLRPPASSKPDVLVKVENVSKIFCRDFKKSLKYGVQDSLRDLFSPGNKDDQRVTEKRELRSGEFHAVNDVSFELRRGECLGLIGRNGAGKTTLLKMLNGLIKPDQGRIAMRGRIGAVIALGSGFNPLLTGRENIYVNGSVLGLSRSRIESKFQEIVEFAEIDKFIDSPVQSYSSGMQVRLGFAIATALDPDVLILDEVLAVGDAAFRAKCYTRIGKLAQNAAIIFVSHSMQQVAQICQKGVFLKKGRVAQIGNIGEVIEAYNDENAGGFSDGDAFLHLDPPAKNFVMRPKFAAVNYRESLSLQIDLDLEVPMPDSTVRVTLYDENGNVAAEWNSKRLGIRFDFVAGSQSFAIQLRDLHLAVGSYRLALALNDGTGIHLPVWSYKNHSIRVLGNTGGVCAYQLG